MGAERHGGGDSRRQRGMEAGIQGGGEAGGLGNQFIVGQTH